MWLVVKLSVKMVGLSTNVCLANEMELDDGTCSSRTLLEDELNAKACEVQPAIFKLMSRDREGEVLGFILLHVDDVLFYVDETFLNTHGDSSTWEAREDESQLRSKDWGFQLNS